ncbi:MAG: Maf family protein [Eggerthellaceae bacterium]|nr:Maf family protein [Eggerthellaceae bacterium]MDR2721294.1 Maf family protein [Coriobacteriaceae bacterium]
MEQIDIILASASPRRKQLLEDAGVRFRVQVSPVDETLETDAASNPEEAAKSLAEKKAGATVQEVLMQNPRGVTVVMGADTMVVFEGEIFGKPRSLSDGTRMLRKLSGNTHQVITAVSVWIISVSEDEKVSIGRKTFAETSLVTFKLLSDEEIADYLRRGESFDKAGAYAAQGEGAKIIAKIEGDLDTVIGLPVAKLLQEFPDLLNT